MVQMNNIIIYTWPLNISIQIFRDKKAIKFGEIFYLLVHYITVEIFFLLKWLQHFTNNNISIGQNEERFTFIYGDIVYDRFQWITGRYTSLLYNIYIYFPILTCILCIYQLAYLISVLCRRCVQKINRMKGKSTFRKIRSFEHETWSKLFSSSTAQIPQSKLDELIFAIKYGKPYFFVLKFLFARRHI